MGSIEEVSKISVGDRVQYRTDARIRGQVVEELNSEYLWVKLDGAGGEATRIRRSSLIAEKDDRSPGRITVDEMADEHGAADQPGTDYIEALEDRLISMIDNVGEAMTQIYGIASEPIEGSTYYVRLMWAKAKLERIANIAEAREPDEDYKPGTDR